MQWMKFKSEGAMAIIAKIQGALDQGVAHFNRKGQAANHGVSGSRGVDAWRAGGRGA